MTDPQLDLLEDRRKPWLDFFLSCANEVSASFRIGAPPKMTYLPIQLDNGTRNVISVWNEGEGIRAAFVVPESLEFVAALRESELNWDYQEHPHHHLNVFLPAQPDERLCILLRPIAAEAAAGVLSGSSSSH